MMRRWANLLAVVVLAVGLLGASGDSTRFDKVGHQMMCTCGCNQVLLDCNHVGCSASEKMRKELQAGIDRGDTNEQIFAWFTNQYGPTVLAAPTTKGFDLVAWVIPFAVFTASIALVMWVAQRWKLAPPSAPVPAGGAGMDRLREQARQETEL